MPFQGFVQAKNVIVVKVDETSRLIGVQLQHLVAAEDDRANESCAAFLADPFLDSPAEAEVDENIAVVLLAEGDVLGLDVQMHNVEVVQQAQAPFQVEKGAA